MRRWRINKDNNHNLYQFVVIQSLWVSGWTYRGLLQVQICFIFHHLWAPWVQLKNLEAEKTVNLRILLLLLFSLFSYCIQLLLSPSRIISESCQLQLPYIIIISPSNSSPIIVSDMSAVLEEICQPQPPLATPRSCTEDLIRLNGLERHSVSLFSVHAACQLSVSSIDAGWWLSGVIAIMAYEPSSSLTSDQPHAALKAIDLIRLDRNKLSVSLFVCLLLLVIF